MLAMVQPVKLGLFVSILYTLSRNAFFELFSRHHMRLCKYLWYVTDQPSQTIKVSIDCTCVSSLSFGLLLELRTSKSKNEET